MRNYNALTVEAYNGTSRILAPGDLERAEGIAFGTGYPGGLFLEGSFYVPRDVLAAWAIGGASRIVIRNGLAVCYEGWVANLERLLDTYGRGMLVPCMGAWGSILMKRRLNKPWCDTRLGEEAWAWNASASGAEKCTIDRYNRLRFTPKREAWSAGEQAIVTYTAPAGQTIKRIAFNYDLQEAGQKWVLGLWNHAAVATIWQAWASNPVPGTPIGYDSSTLAIPTQAFTIYFIADANQTPASDGTIYGQITNPKVYTETGAIDLTEVAKDIIGAFSDLNSSVDYIQSNAYTLEPFITNGEELLADILTRAAGYGDAALNQWAVGCLESEKAPSPNGKPVLFAEPYPVLTDYDYIVAVDEPNLEAPISYDQDFGGVWNAVHIEYKDAEGKTRYLTPADDANLKDDASIAAYGRRDYLLQLDTASTATATNAARRFLAAHKEPRWRMTAPVNVRGYVRSKSGQRVPASQIRAGKRLKIENYSIDISGSGLTFLISQTRYKDEHQVCSISAGVPADPLFPVLTPGAR